mmetsp:Transcript_50346/g.161145  ORF Transcript_50346/g.161145 Transcript_50346/m.161145 type:complete len:238 (+) Transcript_50346:224-937(+)
METRRWPRCRREASKRCSRSMRPTALSASGTVPMATSEASCAARAAAASTASGEPAGEGHATASALASPPSGPAGPLLWASSCAAAAAAVAAAGCTTPSSAAAPVALGSSLWPLLGRAGAGAASPLASSGPLGAPVPLVPASMVPESRCRPTADELGPARAVPPAVPLDLEMSSAAPGAPLSSACFARANPTRGARRSKTVTNRRRKGSPKMNRGPLGGGTSSAIKEKEQSESERSM